MFHKSILFLISIFLFTGCAKSNILSDLKNSLKNVDKTEDTNTKEASLKIDNWKATKVSEMKRLYQNDIYLSENGEGKLYPLKEGLLKKINTHFSNELNYQFKQKSMKDNAEYMVYLKNTIRDISSSISYYQNLFTNEIKDFDTNVNVMYYPLTIYCTNNNIPLGNCNKGSNIKKDSSIAVYLLKQEYWKQFPEIKEYYNILEEYKNKCTKMKDDIEEYSINYEYEQLFADASNNHKYKISNYSNNILSSEINYQNFRISKSTIYDLGNSKVLQSIKGGVLLIGNGSYGTSNNVFFLQTTKSFPDGYIFQNGELKVIYSAIKNYTSILGVSKKVYSFVPMKLSKKYYFI